MSKTEAALTTGTGDGSSADGRGEAGGAGPTPVAAKAGRVGSGGRPRLVSLLQLETGPKRTLVVDGPGFYIGKHSERLQVKLYKEIVEEAPLFDLEQVLIVGRGVSLSSDVVAVCAEQGIALNFLSERDDPQATLIPTALGATVKTRRQQLAAFGDQRGVHLAKAFATGKLINSARLLRYLAKNRRESRPRDYEAAGAAAVLIEAMARQLARLEGVTADTLRQSILTLEGHAAETYWTAARRLLLAEVDWQGRHTRGAQDPVNASLNYGYKILHTHVQRAILLAGLDPFGGFLHVDRPGKPSLALDMVEEFRQMAVDRCVFALFNQGVRMETEDGWLTQASRQAIVDRLRERMEGIELYEGKRQALRIIVQHQARRVASYLRGEREAYHPFVGRW